MNKQAIRSRLKLNHKLLIAHPGPSSPMSRIEPLLLDMILQLSDMNAPVTCREGLELVRSLVKDSVMINKINSWKDKHLHQDLDDESDDEDNDQEIIGKGW